MDSRCVRAVFGAATPSLEGVVLHEVRLRRDGPSVYLRFDLREFPVDPPRKWANFGYNTVQIELNLYGVYSVEISNLGTESVIDLNLSTCVRDGKRVVHARTSENSATHLDVVAGSVSVSKMSAYTDDSP
ncbi:Imm50 family immunity protein [Nocardia sp. NPDC055002]